MGAAAEASFWLGYTLLLIAFVSSVAGALRRRDRYRLDITFFVALLAFAPAARGVAGTRNVPAAILRLLLIFLLPYALVRLTRHVKDVARFWLTTSLGLGCAAALTVGILERGSSRTVVVGLMYLYSGVALALVGLALATEARRSVGVRRRRLAFAATGTLLLSLAFLCAIPGLWSLAVGLTTSAASQIIQGFALILYFFAFSPPRFLLDRWRRGERADYLGRVAEREPEERGRKAADDLFSASVSGIGGAATIVAIAHDSDASILSVAAASESALVGGILSPGSGLLATVLGSGRPKAGRPSDCEPDVARHLTTQAVQVLVAPVTASRCWGLVIVALRRGALFPEDDLAMLAQLARDAATALDHAELVVERRDLARQASDRKLREIESRVGLMIDSIKDYALLILDADGRVAAWHIGGQHLFGYSQSDVNDQPAAGMYGLEPLEFAAWLEEARTRGVAEREGPCRRLDGSTFIGATVIRPLASELNEPPGFAVVTRDVTERRQLEERLRQGQKMEAIGQLAGGIAHDFNNLLTAILGYAEWLDRDLHGDPRRTRVLEIQRAAERAADLTRQLLAFSRRQMLRPSVINLSELATGLLPMLQRLIGEQIEIVDATSSVLSSVLGDRSQVEQIVVNLVVNARDAMPEGGRLTIRTTDVWLGEASAIGLRAGSYVLLEVSDTGIGMDSVTQSRVFEPFFTTKDVGRGTGLGLSTVYGIVQQMGGAIEVESELGRGTTLRLYFPETTSAVVEMDHPAARETIGGRETLLLVEDDEAVRTYLTGVLQRNGYRVISAPHSTAALALVQSFGDRVHLVISDVVMPDGTGPELVQQLGDARPGLSALYISGHDGLVLARQSPEVRPGDVLQKPFSSAELLTKIRQILSAA